MPSWWALISRWLQTAAPSFFLGNRFIELTLLGSLFAALLLVCIRLFKLEPRIRAQRHSMMLELYSLYLFHRSPRRMFYHEARLIKANLKLIAVLGPIILVGSALFSLGYDACRDRYALAPFKVAEEFVVRVKLLSSGSPPIHDAELHIEARDISIEAVVRSPAARTVWTRISGANPGVVGVRTGRNEHVAFDLNIGDTSKPCKSMFFSKNVEVAIQYLEHKSFWGRHGWVCFLLVVSMIACLPLSRVMRIHF